MRITIPEYNEKPLIDLTKKISRRNSFSICLTRVSDEIREVENNTGKFYIKVITYDISSSHQVEGWKVLGLIEHTKEGNIVKNFSGDEIPKRFYNADPVCEHCNTTRRRNKTCILRRDDQYIQVGSSCVEDYTHKCISYKSFNELTKFFHSLYSFEDYKENFPGSSYLYEELDTMLLFSIEMVNKFGYVKKDVDIVSGKIPTARDILYFTSVLAGRGYHLSNAEYSETERRIQSSNFDPYTKENKELAAKIKEWISSSEDDSDYMHNLKVIFSSDYIERKYLGYLVSAYPSYRRAHPEQTEQSKSIHIGTIGERITIRNIKEFNNIYTYDSYYGVVHLYKIVDEYDNIFIWRTGKSIENAKEIVGRVKDHSVYNGAKQTEISNCKIIQ